MDEAPAKAAGLGNIEIKQESGEMSPSNGITVITTSGEKIIVDETLFDKAQASRKIAEFVRDQGSLTPEEHADLMQRQEAVQGPMVFVKQGNLAIGMMEIATAEPKIVQCVYVLGDRNVYMLKANVVVSASPVGRVNAKIMGDMSMTNGKAPGQRAA